MGGQDVLGGTVAAVVHQRVVHAAKRRARIDRDVLDAAGAHQVHDQVGAVPRRRRHHSTARVAESASRATSAAGRAHAEGFGAS